MQAGVRRCTPHHLGVATVCGRPPSGAACRCRCPCSTGSPRRRCQGRGHSRSPEIAPDEGRSSRRDDRLARDRPPALIEECWTGEACLGGTTKAHQQCRRDDRDWHARRFQRLCRLLPRGTAGSATLVSAYGHRCGRGPALACSACFYQFQRFTARTLDHHRARFAEPIWCLEQSYAFIAQFRQPAIQIADTQSDVVL